MIKSQTPFYDNWEIIKKESQLTNCTIHTLRHTFMIRCAEKGINVKVVKKMGWTFNKQHYRKCLYPCKQRI